MSTSADIDGTHVNGTVAVELSGTISGIIRGPSWCEVTIARDDGTVSVRFYDSTPVELVDLSEGQPDVIIPEPVEGEAPGGGL